nr:MAG: putative capsid protein [Arizlama virus]
MPRLYSTVKRRVVSRTSRKGKSSRSFHGRRRKPVAPAHRKRSGFGRKAVSLRPTWTNPLYLNSFNYRFVYSDINFNMSTGAGGVTTTNSFSGNSLYDPDQTGAGVQPYGWDQTTSDVGVFNSYFCHCSKITVVFYYSDSDVANCSPTICSLYSSSTGGYTYNDPDDLAIVPGVRQRMLTPVTRGRVVLTSFQRFRHFYPKWEQTTTATNADPTKQFYWNVATNSTGAATIANVKMDVTITYYTTLYKRDDIDES